MLDIPLSFEAIEDWKERSEWAVGGSFETAIFQVGVTRVLSLDQRRLRSFIPPSNISIPSNYTPLPLFSLFFTCGLHLRPSQVKPPVILFNAQRTVGSGPR